MVEPDYYIPLKWRADQIIGEIINAQIASLAADKITGKLTDAQIEALAAEKITGELTDEQIAEINAAKVVGQLTDAQLGGIAAAKIIGEIASGQIKSLAAGKVTGELTSAQIKTIEAAKVTGQLTDAQIKGLTTAKLEGLLSSEQIAGLAVAKLVGQISETQIAAKAITAGKINVATLAAIAVDAGLITAGTFKGVTFETSDGGTVMDNSGLRLSAPQISKVGATSRVQWFREKVTQVAELISYISEAGGTHFWRMLMEAPAGENGAAQASLMVLKSAVGGKNREVKLHLETFKTLAKLYMEVGGFVRTIFDTDEKSHFLQLGGAARKERDFGLVGSGNGLPKEPSLGDRCQYQHGGVIWHLVYDGEGEHPWKKIGGPPLISKTTAENSTASTSYTTLANSPSITTPPVKMVADIWHGSRLIVTGGPSFAARTLFTSGGVEVAGTEDNLNSGAPSGGSVFPEVTLAASTAYTFRYKTSVGTSFWANRYLVIDPKRVG